jgi:hypothetical protein
MSRARTSRSSRSSAIRNAGAPPTRSGSPPCATATAVQESEEVVAGPRPHAVEARELVGVGAVGRQHPVVPEQREAVRTLWGRAVAGEDFTVVAEFGDPERRTRTP